MTHRLYSMKESTIRPTRVLVQVGYDTKYCQVVGNTYRWLIPYSEDRAWKLWQPLSMQADTTQNSKTPPRPPAGTKPAPKPRHTPPRRGPEPQSACSDRAPSA